MRGIRLIAALLMGGYASVGQPLLAQHEHTFEFRIVGQEALFGGATVRDTSVLVDEGINYTLRAVPAIRPSIQMS